MSLNQLGLSLELRLNINNIKLKNYGNKKGSVSV
jgi:hypothetical protein